MTGRERVRTRLQGMLDREPTDDEMQSWVDCRAREAAAFALMPIMEREGLEGLALISAGELATVSIDTYKRVMKELTGGAFVRAGEGVGE